MDILTFLKSLDASDEQKLIGALQDLISQRTEEIPSEDEKVNILNGYEYAASDSQDHIGEYYVMPPAFMKGKVGSVTVGSESYRYVMEWPPSELWYGRPGDGPITITLRDGSVYKSQDAESPVSNDATTRLEANYFGKTNNGRATWYLPNPLASLPTKFYLTSPGCVEKLPITISNGRYGGVGSPDWVVKTPDHPTPEHGTGIIAPASCNSKKCHIEF